MPDNFLTIAREVASVVGMKDISSLVGNNEPHARSMLTLLNRGGRILAQKRGPSGQGWVVLTREFVFTTQAGEDEYQLPEDYQELVDGTIWDRNSYREARGPLSPREWQSIKSGLIETTSITPNFRLRRSRQGTGRSFFIDPVPSSSETLVIEYTSNHWLTNSTGDTFRSKIVADTDEPLFDDDLVTLDLEWRFKQSRGLSFAAELAEFEIERDRRFGKDPGPRKIYLGQGRRLSFRDQVPETGYGGITVG